MNRASLILSVIATAVVAMLLRNSLRETIAAEVKVQPSTTPKSVRPRADKFEHLSSTSCAASACHGGGKPGAAGSEYTTWAPDLNADTPSDPHARAYSVLSNQTSLRMAKQLGLGKPTDAALCLGCHATPSSTIKEIRSEGVGCGVCHGPAEKWVAAHVEPAWKEKSVAEKWGNYGFYPTKNSVSRTLLCASCHIGDADREVNHDMIAAGHPPLRFEASQFHSHPRYRKHWMERGNATDFELRTYIVGRLVNMRSVAELARVRAERSIQDSRAPYPELSSRSCYSCHQSIGQQPSSRKVANRPNDAGLWEPWHTGGFESVIQMGLVKEFMTGDEAWTDVVEFRKLAGDPTADPKLVASAAARAVAVLDPIIDRLRAAEEQGKIPIQDQQTALTLANIVAKSMLHERTRELMTSDWDTQSVRYLACAAAYHAAGGRRQFPFMTAPLNELEKLLVFPIRSSIGRIDGPAPWTDLRLERLKTAWDTIESFTREGGK